MKKLIVIIFIVTVTMGCSTSVDNSEKNIALVENYIHLVESLDSEGMDKFLADDYMGYGPSHDNEINKEDVIKNWKNAFCRLCRVITFSKRIVFA